MPGKAYVKKPKIFKKEGLKLFEEFYLSSAVVENSQVMGTIVQEEDNLIV